MNHHQPTLMSNFSQPSSDLSLDEEREVLRRETEKQALAQLEKARVRFLCLFVTPVVVFGDPMPVSTTQISQSIN